MASDWPPIRNCPLCDSIAALETERDGYYIACTNDWCGCRRTVGFPEDGIAKWNTRPADKEIAELRKQLSDCRLAGYHM